MPRLAPRVLLRKVLRKVALVGGLHTAALFLRVLRRSWHVDRIHYERFFSAPVIVAFWHGDLLVGAAEVMSSKRRDFATLASRSRDGDIAAGLAKLVGVEPLRGGSSRGQVEALRSMERWLREGKSILLAVDGPRGPKGVVKSGIILLSSRTGVPIVPAGAIPLDTRFWQFRSWDSMWLPKAGARIAAIFEEPITVPPDADHQQIEEYRRLLEHKLHMLHRKK